MGDCRKWRAEMEEDRATPSFEEWIHGAMRTYAADAPTEVDVDSLLLCTKPSQKAMRYTKMKAFGNHFRVLDDTTNRMKTYDSGITSVFDVPTEDARNVSVNYVGVLKDILKLDYGPMRTPVILLRCEWIKKSDNRGNPTYIWDEIGFLVVNFRHKLPSMCDPFIFPSQATQVFFSNESGLESCTTERTTGQAGGSKHIRCLHKHNNGNKCLNRSNTCTTSTYNSVFGWCNYVINGRELVGLCQLLAGKPRSRRGKCVTTS
jgi:hypothetical protein